jgi:hypothetical protein
MMQKFGRLRLFGWPQRLQMRLDSRGETKFNLNVKNHCFIKPEAGFETVEEY